MRGKSVKGSSTPTRIQQIIHRCTASNCRRTIKSHHDAALHPLLDCLVCRECYLKYGNGNFAAMWPDGVDENGDDNYCRWCCDGGDLLGCMNDCANDGERCHYMFCEDCLRFNVPEDEYLDERKQGSEITWFCLSCDRNKLKILRTQAQEAIADLSSRQTNEPMEEVTPQSTNGRSSKNSERTRDSIPPPETPSKGNQLKPATTTPKSTPTSTAKVTAVQDDNIDIDVTSLSPPKQINVDSSTEDEENKEKKSENKEEQSKSIENKSGENKSSENKSSETKTHDKATKETSKERETVKKPSTTVTREPERSSSVSSSSKEGKKVKDNFVSKRDREARVEGEPIVAPPNANLIKLGHKNRDTRKSSDSFSASSNPTKKRRTELAEDLAPKISSSNVKGLGSSNQSIKQTGLEPQMTVGRNSTGPSSMVDKQHSIQTGSTDGQVAQRTTIGATVSNGTRSLNTSISKFQSTSFEAKKKTKLNLADFKKRLDYYDKTKQVCLEEINSKWNKIKEMADVCYPDPDNRGRQSMGVEIESIRTPILEIESMLKDLKNLCC